MGRLLRHPLVVVAAGAAVVVTVLLLTGASLYHEDGAGARASGAPRGAELLTFSDDLHQSGALGQAPGKAASGAPGGALGGAELRASSTEAAPELRVFFVTIVGTDAAVDLLASQLEHFHGLGIPYERMGVVLHVKPAPGAATTEEATPVAPYLDSARALLARFAGVQSRLWHDKFVDNVKVTQLRLMLEQLGFTRRQLQHGARPAPDEPHDWIVYADSDELHQYIDLASDAPLGTATSSSSSSSSTLPRLLAFLTAHDVGAIEGRFLDRVGEGGALVALDTARPPFVQFPYGCDITGRIARGTPTKLMAWRPVMVKAGDGGFHEHNGGDPTNHLRRILGPSVGGWVHHFKWVHGIVEETRDRLADFSARNFSYVKEVRLLAEYFDRNNGRVDVAPEAEALCEGGAVGTCSRIEAYGA